MYNDSVYLPIVATELFLIFLALIINKIMNSRKEKEKDEFLKEKRSWLPIKYKLLMINSEMEKYKNGENAYTVLRNIQEILWEETEKKDEEEDK